jgi:hypothetical protein
MPVSETPNIATTHLEAQVRALVRTLRSYGPLHERTLARLVRGSQWRHGCMHDALARAVREGRVRALGFGFYEVRDGVDRGGPS